MRIVVLLAAIATLALAGCGDMDDAARPPTIPSPGGPVFYTALGASDALGIGASVPCVPFAPCPNGTGYVPVIARRLGEQRSVTLVNLGIPGAVIGPDIQQLGNQHGRNIPANFIEREMPFVPTNTNVVTIVAGPNDTNAIAAAVEDGAGGGDPLGFIANQIRAFGVEYDTLVRGVRQRAPSTHIVVANVPNFAGLPFTASYTLQQRQALQRISVGISTMVINGLVAQGIVVIDLLCDPRSYDSSNYSSDGFHPNDAGYQVLAAEMFSAITTAIFAAPRTTCPQMTIVPPL